MHPKPTLYGNANQCVQNYPREMHTNSMILAKNPQTNEKKSADFSAFGNGFRCIQNQSLDKCNQISQFIADGNGFGCAQNQWYRKI